MDDWPLDDPRRTRVILRKILLDQGLDDRAIGRLVASGELARPRYGSYVDGAAWSACDELGRYAVRIRCVLERARAEVVVSHLSAAVEWDVPFFDLVPDVVHVTRRDMRAGRREAGVVQHLGRLHDDDLVTRNGVTVTAPSRTALDCATLMPVEHAVALVGDLLHRGLTTKDELRETAERMAQWPGSLQNRIVVERADGRCESVGEHRTLYLCWRQGLPAPEPQVEVRDESGRVVARVDFAWPEHKVFLEFDGDVKYRGLLRDGEDVTDVVLREKRREKLITDLTGWTCIRITWADLYHPERTAARIRRLLVAAAPIAN